MVGSRTGVRRNSCGFHASSSNENEKQGGEGAEAMAQTEAAAKMNVSDMEENTNRSEAQNRQETNTFSLHSMVKPILENFGNRNEQRSEGRGGDKQKEVEDTQPGSSPVNLWAKPNGEVVELTKPTEKVSS